MKIIWGITILLVLVFSSITSVAGSVSSISISPENPVIGDTITVTGKASPNEILYPTLRYSLNVKPGAGNIYVYSINSIRIPPQNNNFSVTASKVENLKVSVNYIINLWYDMNAVAVNDVAKIAYGKVYIPKHYNIKISGTAIDKNDVNLIVTATSKEVVNNEGKFKLKYSTSELPPGTYYLDIGDVTKTIILSAVSDFDHKKKTSITNDNEAPQVDNRDIETSSRANQEILETETVIPDATPEIEETVTESITTSVSPVPTTPAQTEPEIKTPIFQRFLNWLGWI